MPVEDSTIHQVQDFPSVQAISVGLNSKRVVKRQTLVKITLCKKVQSAHCHKPVTICRKGVHEQTTQQKDSNDGQSVRDTCVQSPHHPHRERQNENIGDNVGYCVSDKRGFKVDTGAGNTGVPSSRNRSALEDAHEDNSHAPRDRYPTQDDGGNADFSRREDAAVHEENRNFGDCYCCDVDALEYHQELCTQISAEALISVFNNLNRTFAIIIIFPIGRISECVPMP